MQSLYRRRFIPYMLSFYPICKKSLDLYDFEGVSLLISKKIWLNFENFLQDFGLEISIPIMDPKLPSDLVETTGWEFKNEIA